MLAFPRFTFSTKVTLGLSVGLCILVVLGALGAYIAGEIFKTSQELRRLPEFRVNLETVRREVDRADAAQLRYQVTANPAYEGEFRETATRVAAEIEVLRGMLAAADQKARLEELKQAAQSRLDVLADAIKRRNAGDTSTALLFGERSVAAGQNVQGLVDAIGERQWQLARESGSRVENMVTLLLRLAIWGAAFAVVLLIWTIYIINRYERDRKRAEGDLANAKQRLDFALEGSISAVWDWNLPQDEIFLSAGWAHILGAEANETTVAPAALLGLVHHDDRKRVQAAIQAALTGATPDYRVEHRVKRVDGKWIWILSRGRVVRRDAAGRALRITGTNQDVTERKAIELALKEHDDRLQLALAAAGMVRWDWNVAEDEFVWPDSPERLLGPAQKGGYLGLQDMVHGADLVRFIQTVEQSARSGEPYKDEFRVLRTDGTIVWVAARGYVVRDAGGKVARVIGVAQDVSEIKQAEQALRASERELRLITDSVPALIGAVGADENVLFCNRALAALAGAQPKDVIGRPLRQLFGDEVYRVLEPHARRAIAGAQVHFQRSQKRPDGETADYDVTYIPRRGALGEAAGFYSLLTDITELKRLDRMKSEFVSTVSHELRTPLTSIRGSLGILAGGVAGPLSDKVRSFIDIAKDNCERLIRLINDILDMEKIESGKMTFQLQVLDLMELVEQTVKANEGFAAQHNVRLRVVSSLPGARVHGDSDRLAQVLTNFISNACKFSPATGDVDIAVVADGERIRVGVSDHGPGISEAFRLRIFQKFSQEDSSDLRQKGGTGLGLSIAKAIVEGLGGEIGFDTETGKGSTFYISLPRWRNAATPSGTASPVRSRLLVCDGDAQAGKLLQTMLHKAGYDSDLAANAVEVKSLLSERRYVAMTLDLGLCDQDALSLMRELRADPASSGLPVIALSADAEGGELKLGDGHPGIVDWLSKPIDEQRLLADLRAVECAGMRPRILHVEDDTDVRDVVATLARDIAEVEAAGSVAEARVKLGRVKFDLVLLDLGLPDGSGWDLLPLINGLSPPVRVVIFSAHDAERGSEAAPYAFLVKSQTSEQRLIDVIQEAVRLAA